jgi:uncharacterized membrane protein YfcA
MWGLGWTLPQAAPVALVAVCAGAAFGTIAAWDVSVVRYRAAMLLAAASWLTAPLGLQAARVLPLAALTLLFAGVLVLVATRLVLQARRAPDETAVVRAATRPPVCQLDPRTGRFDWNRASLAVMAGIGALTGFLAGLLGVGGGFVIVPALRAWTDLSMHSAVATSLMAIALVSAGTVAAAAWQGLAIPWPVAVPFLAGTLGGMLAGRLCARRIAGPRLQLGFALCMLLVALGMGAHGLGLM